jgi:chromosome segregation ATPase
LEKQLDLEASADVNAQKQEKTTSKHDIARLSDELQKCTELEKKSKNAKKHRLQQLETFGKETKSLQERVEAKTMERNRVRKELRTLASDYNILNENLRQEKVKCSVVSEDQAHLQNKIGLVQQELNRINAAATEALQEYENVKSTVIAWAEGMIDCDADKEKLAKQNDW